MIIAQLMVHTHTLVGLAVAHLSKANIISLLMMSLQMLEAAKT